MNRNSRNKEDTGRMGGSLSNNEKIIAVNDIKLNSLLINGSRVEYSQVFSVRLGKNHEKLGQSLHEIRNRALKDEG